LRSPRTSIAAPIASGNDGSIGRVLACIDIGSNTTRLLVAEVADGGLREVLAQRVFTSLGRGRSETDPIPAAKIALVATVVADQAQAASHLGASEVVAVATAAIREAPNRDELATAIAQAAGIDVRVIGGEEEARLAFAGATARLDCGADQQVAVVDVGGWSSEVAVGTIGRGVTWMASVPVGSCRLADAHLRSDPPHDAELAAADAAAVAALAELEIPPAARGVAVGGSATSLTRLVGERLDGETLGRGIEQLASMSVADAAGRFELDPERVRLLPAGMLILAAASARLGLPLEVGRGGLREGVLLEMLAAREDTA
jgi:exopolyphosphatase/guanosine-5'-triphosphate,3'-diphosphate pyrophosphatase